MIERVTRRLVPAAVMTLALPAAAGAAHASLHPSDVSSGSTVDAHRCAGVAAAPAGFLPREPLGWGPSRAERRAVEGDLQRRLRELPSGRRSVPTVRVVFHIVADATGRGRVSDERIRRQMRVLRRDFNGMESSESVDTQFRFALADIRRYRKSSWHYDRKVASMFRRTHVGGTRTLNVWVIEPEYLGMSSLPFYARQNPSRDGIRLHVDSIPGTTKDWPYALGRTLTHETGHWLGLYHTFEGGCLGGDYVKDTPAEAEAHYVCSDSDSCPRHAGTDPIHNYMNYTEDLCLNRFTPGQNRRMVNMWRIYRARR